MGTSSSQPQSLPSGRLGEAAEQSASRRFTNLHLVPVRASSVRGTVPERDSEPARARCRGEMRLIEIWLLHFESGPYG